MTEDWEEMKVEEIRTDNTEPLKNALERIAELEKEYASLKGLRKYELNVAKLEIENLEKENAELKARLNAINQLIPKLEKENAELKEKLKPENCLKLLAKEDYIKFSSEQLTYAKTIIQDLLDNTDEYARQRAEDFLKENK